MSIAIFSAPVSAAQPSARKLFTRVTASENISSVESILQTKDKGWLVSGMTYQSGKALIKYDSTGTKQFRIDTSINNGGYIRAAAESQDANTYFAISSGSSTDIDPIIYKFSKNGSQWVESTWTAATNVVHDGITYRNTILTGIILDDDGKYVVSGYLTDQNFNKRVHFFFKIADIPTCNQQNDFFCSDIIWQVFSDPIFQGDIGYYAPRLVKEASGEFLTVDDSIYGSVSTDNIVDSVIKIKESANGQSASIDWQVSIDGLNGLFYVKPLGNDEYILGSSNGGQVGKYKKTENTSTGEITLEKLWMTNLNVGTVHPYSGNSGLDGIDTMSDGSVVALYTLSDTAPEEATIPALANLHGNHVVTKINASGEIVYTIRTDSSTSTFSELVVNKEDDSYTISIGLDKLEKYKDNMIYDVDFNVKDEGRPSDFEPIDSRQVWGNTSVDLDRPSYSGYNFKGWYENSSLTGQQLSRKTFTDDTTLYGAFEVRNITVYYGAHEYDDQGEYIRDLPVESKTVTYGETNDYTPNMITPEGDTLDGWYHDSRFSDPVDFSDPDSIIPNPSTSNMKYFYGRFIRETNLVNFHVVSSDNPDYSLQTPIRVRYGETVANPGLTNRQGYIFNGWYTNESLSNPYDFNTPVTGELHLYGEWINSVLRIDEDGIHYPGNIQDGSAIYDEDTHTLILEDYDGGQIEILNITDDFTIIIKGDNIVDSGSGDGIHSSAPLTIDGDGTLNITTSGDEAAYSCILSSDGDLTINNGVISIEDQSNLYRDGVCANGDVTVNGGDIDISAKGRAIISNRDSGNINLNGGQIDISAGYNLLQTYNGGSININGAEVNLARKDQVEGEPCEDINVTESRYLIIDKGTINAKCNIYADIIVINDGTSNVGGINGAVFNQNGGKVNIDNGNSDSGAEIAGIQVDYAVFNGGTMTIEKTQMGILSQGGYLDEEEKAELAARAQKVGGVIPKNAPLEFNGGDVMISSDLTPIIVLGPTKADDLTSQIYLGNNMVKDPDYAELSQGELMGDFVTAFSDGKGEIEISIGQSGVVVNNTIKAVHIYYVAPPVVPNTDDEENPNTVDFQILGLAGAVFIAVMLQGMIIADLYRRLHGYEEEIATEPVVENTMIANEPITQNQPEEQPVKTIEDVKPAEEVKVNFEKHDDIDDYSGPGDEYYY